METLCSGGGGLA